MSLWGTAKKPDDNEQEGEGVVGQDDDMPSSRTQPSRIREPDERDRLLPAQPRPLHRDGYLDPDDPAVSSSPLNLTLQQHTDNGD